MIHTSFTPEDISLIYRYTEHAYQLYSVPYCSASCVKFCKRDWHDRIELQQDSIVANPKRYTLFR